jgi:hypothetical protein
MRNDQQDQPQRATFDDVEDAADAILGRWSDDESLPDREDEEATSEDDINETDAFEDYEEDETDLAEEDTEENLEDPDEEETAEDEAEEASEEEEFEELTDETLVEIPVNGEIKQASIKELKRLYGQEASLTRKSQETAAKRKEAEDIIQKTSMSYQKLIERAEARFKPYSEVDMLVASRQMDADGFAQLRKEAQDAESDLKFLKEESDAFFKQAQADYSKQHQAAAQECVRVLQDNLPDWGNDLYNDIRSYAVSVGLPQDQVDQYVDPNVIMILNKARLYDMGKAAADQKKSKAVRVNKSAGKKVLRSRKAPATDADLRVQRQRKASQKLRSNPSISGDLDDIADALMSRWEQ